MMGLELESPSLYQTISLEKLQIVQTNEEMNTNSVPTEM